MSPSVTSWRCRFGTSTPIALRPGIGARMRTSGDAIAYAMSWLRPVTRLTFTPGASSSSYRVTVGPMVMPMSCASTPCWAASPRGPCRPPRRTGARRPCRRCASAGWPAAASRCRCGAPGPRSIAICPPGPASTTGHVDRRVGLDVVEGDAGRRRGRVVDRLVVGLVDTRRPARCRRRGVEIGRVGVVVERRRLVELGVVVGEGGRAVDRLSSVKARA